MIVDVVDVNLFIDVFEIVQSFGGRGIFMFVLVGLLCVVDVLIIVCLVFVVVFVGFVMDVFGLMYVFIVVVVGFFMLVFF